MYTQPEDFVVVDPKLNPGGVALLGNSITIELDSEKPLEGMEIDLAITAGATGPTQLLTSNPDGVMAILKRARLTVSPSDNGARPVLDKSGMCIIEGAANRNINLDRCTQAALRLAQGSTIANNLQFRIKYFIPFVHPQIEEPHRERFLLPVHIHKGPPMLTLDFETAANLFSAGALSSVVANVTLFRREMNTAQTQEILDAGGFIDYDMLESDNPLAVNTQGPIDIPINKGGEYLDMLVRQYRGSASASTLTRDTVDRTTTFGAETIWGLKVAGQTRRQFRWNTQQARNDRSRVSNSENQTYSPNFGGLVAANTAFPAPASVMFDFLTDGVSAGNATYEFGSTLNLTGLSQTAKATLTGEQSSVSGTAHHVFVSGYRVTSDLSRWKAIKLGAS